MSNLIERLRTWKGVPDKDHKAIQWLDLLTAEAANHIEELEREASERNEEHLALVEENHALKADNARLREWIADNIYSLDRSCILTRDGNLYCDCCNAEKGKPHNQGCILATTPEQSLAKEHGALQADNARLREVLSDIWQYEPWAAEQRALEAIAATPEQSLAAITDPLNAHIARLRADMEKIADPNSIYGPFPEANSPQWRAMAIVVAREALSATPEQSLARLRNQWLEEAAQRIDDKLMAGGTGRMYAEKIRQLKKDYP